MTEISELYEAFKRTEERELGYEFIKESNKIEGIERDPTREEITEFWRFMRLKKIAIKQLEQFVRVYQPGALIRDQEGMNVRVGNYHPMEGGVQIRKELKLLLKMINDRTITPFAAHHHYEKLHPFMDGNGRSGRMLWCWMMGSVPKRGFLRVWYDQSLR